MIHTCRFLNHWLGSLLFISGALSSSLATPQTTAFVYQGQLRSSGSPAQGFFELRFALYDAAEAGAIVGGPVTAAAVGISNGLFAVTLDFGATPFAGEARWLEIGVRTNGSPTAFALLKPRQALAATPYALQALNARTVPASGIVGSLSGSQLAPGTITAAQLASGSITSTQLAAGAVTSTQLAGGAVQAAHIAPGVIGAPQLARRYDAGRIDVGGDSAPVTLSTDGSATLSVPFNSPFNQSPIVTFSLEDLSPGQTILPQIALVAKSLTNFSVRLRGFDPTLSVVYDRSGSVQVDAQNDVGDGNSAATVGGLPAVSCFDKSRKALLYARAFDGAGVSWPSPIVVDAGPDVGTSSRLLVVSGFPAISYVDYANHTLRYVRALNAEGTAWGTPTVVSADCGEFTSLAIVGGNPAIAFVTQTNSRLAFVRANDVTGLSWGSRAIVDTNRTAYPCLALVNGRPALAYHLSASESLRYARAADANGTAWNVAQTLRTGIYNGSYCLQGYGKYAALTVVDGNPAVACYRQDHTGSGTTNISGVVFARANDADGSTWPGLSLPISGAYTDTEVRNSRVYYFGKTDLGRDVSLKVINNIPRLLFRATLLDDNNVAYDALVYKEAADASAVNWVRAQAIYRGTVVPSFLDLNGLPAACFYQDGQLKFLGHSATDWNSAPVQIPQAGPEPNGLVGETVTADGLPLVVFHDPSKGDLKILKAQNQTGTAWPATPTSIDTGGNTGQDTSMAWLDGALGIAYRDPGRGHLRFVRSQGSQWSLPVTVDSTSDNGLYPSLGMVAGAPALAYFDSVQADLRFVRARTSDGSSWANWKTLDNSGQVGMRPSLASVNDRPAIAYLGPSALKYMWAEEPYGDKWNGPITVATFSPTKCCTASLAMVNGNPAIALSDMNLGLQFIRASDTNGALWGARVKVDPIPGTGEYASLAVIGGKPALAYWDSSAGVLKFSRSADTNGSSWGTPIIVDINGAGSYACLREVEDKPVIAYYSSGLTKDLKFVAANDSLGTTWGSPVTVDSAGDVGEGVSLAFDGAKIRISYNDRSNGTLKVATEGWSSQAVDGGASVGKFLSLTPVGGRPAVSYYDESNQRLKFALAANANATSWNTPVVVDSTPQSGLYSSLAEVSAYPAIAYYDAQNANLKFVRAANTLGTTWNTSILIDGSGDVGRFASLAVVSGNPAIAYYDASLGDLKYVRATTADGSAWGTPTTPDPGDAGQDVGRYAALAVVNGRPAIAYYDVRFGELKYIRANDATGAGWGGYRALDKADDVGRFICLRVIGGKPVISYYLVTAGDLRLMRAKDADGSSWESPVTLDSANDVGRYSTLASVNGNPSVTYFDYTAGKLKNYYPVKHFQVNWFAVDP